MNRIEYLEARVSRLEKILGVVGARGVEKMEVRMEITKPEVRPRPEKRKRNNSYKNLIYRGKQLDLIDWCKELNLSYSVMSKRLQNKWSIEKAFNTPVDEKKSRIMSLTRMHQLHPHAEITEVTQR